MKRQKIVAVIQSLSLRLAAQCWKTKKQKTNMIKILAQGSGNALIVQISVRD